MLHSEQINVMDSKTYSDIYIYENKQNLFDLAENRKPFIL